MAAPRTIMDEQLVVLGAEMRHVFSKLSRRQAKHDRDLWQISREDTRGKTRDVRDPV
jgi:hypothetical protein